MTWSNCTLISAAKLIHKLLSETQDSDVLQILKW